MAGKSDNLPTEAEVMEELANKTGLSREEVRLVFDDLVELVKGELRDGAGEFIIPGLVKVKLIEGALAEDATDTGASITNDLETRQPKKPPRLEAVFVEGEERAITAWRPLRSKGLRLAAIGKWGTECSCCGFDFGAFYGDIGEGFAIVHHPDPAAATDGKARDVTVDDVCVVCANCHYMLHREDPPIDVDELKELIRKHSARKSR